MIQKSWALTSSKNKDCFSIFGKIKIFDSYKESDLSTFKQHQQFSKRASNLVIDTSIISASATPFIGIPLVIGKAILFRSARKKREIVK